MMDENAFYIKLYIKMQTQTLGVNGSLHSQHLRIIETPQSDVLVMCMWCVSDVYVMC